MNELAGYLQANKIGKMPKIELSPIPATAFLSVVGGVGYLTYTVVNNISLSTLAGVVAATGLWAIDRFWRFSEEGSNDGYHPLTDPPIIEEAKTRTGKMHKELTATYRQVFKDESITVELDDSHPRFVTHVIHHDDTDLTNKARLRVLARKLLIKTETKKEPPFQITYSWGNGASAITMPIAIPKGQQPRIIPFDKSKIKPRKLVSYLGMDTRGDDISLDRDAAPHIQVIGTTGSGKTILIRNQIFSDWLAFPKAVIYSIDYKGGIESAPHTKFTEDMIEGVKMLNEFIVLAEENWKVVKAAGCDNWFEYEDKYPNQLDPIFLNIDEYPQLVEDGDAYLLNEWEEDKAAARENKEKMPIKPKLVNQLLGKIVRVFRAGGAFVLIGGQQFPAKEYPTVFTNMFDCQACMRVKTDDASRQAIDMNGAELLPEKGGVMFCLASNPVQIGAAAFMTPDERLELLGKGN